MCKLPLRTRLTLWYTLSLSLILLLFATSLYWQMRRSLVAQIDASLQLAAAQTVLDLADEAGLINSVIAERPEAIGNIDEEFVIYLLAADGSVLRQLGRLDDAPTAVPPQTEFFTLSNANQPWRIYNQAINTESAVGWLQVMRELDLVEQTLGDLLLQMLITVPVTLFLAGLGGFFLASRALRPIAQMTQTAESITASDMKQRLNYLGPADEVGRLAATFDKMLARLQSAFERERRFTGDAAHELRTPLTALKGRIGVTLTQPRQPDAYIATLQEMEAQVDRLIHLSNDLLLMARLENGQIEARQERMVLADFLGAVVDQIRPLAEAKTIRLIEAIPPNLIINGQFDLLIRLFLNVLDNAVKYTPENGRIALEAQSDAKTIIITISDNGPGIAAEHSPFLFERFYRVEEDRSRQLHHWQAGAGLGLAIAHEIVQAHGGQLSIESVLEQGTIVKVQLPVGS